MNYGLSDELLAQMTAVFRCHPAIVRVVLFGSRAMQTHRPGSDIDLTVIGDGLTNSDLLIIQIQLDDLGFLYRFDINLLAAIQNPDLVAHIQRVGKTIYESNTGPVKV